MRVNFKWYHQQISLEANAKEVKKKARALLTKNEVSYCVALNPEKLVLASKSSDFTKILLESDLNYCDGIGLKVLFNLKKIARVERMPGIDLFYYLLELCHQEKLTVCFIGASPTVSNKLKSVVEKRYPKINEATFFDGYGDIGSQQLLKGLSNLNPNLTVVALGSPLQEEWIYKNRTYFKKGLLMGVGGSFDVLSGEVKRAPGIFRVTGTEWLYRLFQSPKRIFRQINLGKFLWSSIFLNKLK